MIEASPFAVAEGEPDEREHVTWPTNYFGQEKAAKYYTSTVHNES
jgi:hypothetical protein